MNEDRNGSLREDIDRRREQDYERNKESERSRDKQHEIVGIQKWFDVLDEKDEWRVGYCERKTESGLRVIALDGFHPSYTKCYCPHQGKVEPIRTKTKGLTLPSNNRALRPVLTRKEIEVINNKIQLNCMKSSQLQNTLDNVRVFIRTQLLILVDKIISTPYNVIASMKMIDVAVSKLFVGTINLFFKVLQSLKKPNLNLQGDEICRELFRSTYELALTMQMIGGLHKRSKNFFEDPLNIINRRQGFLDMLIRPSQKPEQGLLSFKFFFKNVSLVKSLLLDEFLVAMESGNLFLALCERSKGQMLQGSLNATTRLVLDEFMALIKVAIRNGEILANVKANPELLSRIQTIFLILNPTKLFMLRKLVENCEKGESQSVLQIDRFCKKPKREDEKLMELEQRLMKLENMLNKTQQVNNEPHVAYVEQLKQPTENLGQQAFLSSLQFMLLAGDIESCRKLVKWRKSLLQVGRIAGWQTALSVGMKTFKKKLISPEDIIQANYEYIMKQAS